MAALATRIAGTAASSAITMTSKPAFSSGLPQAACQSQIACCYGHCTNSAWWETCRSVDRVRVFIDRTMRRLGADCVCAPAVGPEAVATAHHLEVLCSLPLKYCNCYWVGSPFGVPGSGLAQKIAIRHTPQISVRVIADIFVLIPRFSSPATSVTIKNWDGWPCQASDFCLRYSNTSNNKLISTSCAGISSSIMVRFMPKDWIFFALPRWLGLESGGNNLIHHSSARNFIPTCLGANHGIWAGSDHRPEPKWPKCFRQGSVSEGHVTLLPNNTNNLLLQFHQQSSFIADCDSYSARQCRSFWGGLKLPYPLAAFHWRRAVAQCRQHNCPRIRLTLAVSSTKTLYWSLDPTVPHVRNVSDIPNHPFEGRSPWFCNSMQHHTH